MVQVVVTKRDLFWKEKVREQNLPDFVCDELLYPNTEKIRLEDFPGVVSEVLGKLLELLMQKGVIDLKDVCQVLDVDADRVTLVTKQE